MATNDADSDSDAASFHSFHENDHETTTRQSTKALEVQHPRSDGSDINDVNTSDRFPPEEEASLLTTSNELKTNANQLFGRGSFENAIQTYDRALASCPNYLDFEIAVLRSNVAACYIKLQEWKEAVESASKGVVCLDRLEPLPKVKRKKTKVAVGAGEQRNGAVEDEADEEEDGVEEVDEAVAARIENLQKSGRTLDEVRKLQVKILTRRARGRSGQGGWANLQAAEEDYSILLSPTMLPFLTPTDRRHIVEAVKALEPKLQQARDSEMAEMMDKLKGLGNSILKPFGLSTENFKFVKDEKTGGYSMGFDQNANGGVKS